MKNNFAIQREKMVEEQLISRGIKDPKVLAAFRRVPRDRFVPTKYLDSAYGDFPLPIGEGQTISQPYMVALMTECLKLSGKEMVLEIGTGSGYQAAILAELTRGVLSIERIDNLAQKAQKILIELGYRNVQIKVADGTAGWPELAPFNAILVTAGSPVIPQPLIEQLDIQAKLVIPIGGSFSQMLTVVIKDKETVQMKEICPCIFVPLLGKYAWQE